MIILLYFVAGFSIGLVLPVIALLYTTNERYEQFVNDIRDIRNS